MGFGFLSNEFAVGPRSNIKKEEKEHCLVRNHEMADLMQCLWTARDIRPRNAPVASDRLTRLWHQAGQAWAGTEFGRLTVKPRGLCRASVSGSGIAQEKNGSRARPACSWVSASPWHRTSVSEPRFSYLQSEGDHTFLTGLS